MRLLTVAHALASSPYSQQVEDRQCRDMVEMEARCDSLLDPNDVSLPFDCLGMVSASLGVTVEPRALSLASRLDGIRCFLGTASLRMTFAVNRP